MACDSPDRNKSGTTDYTDCGALLLFFDAGAALNLINFGRFTSGAKHPKTWSYVPSNLDFKEHESYDKSLIAAVSIIQFLKGNHLPSVTKS